MLKIKKGFRFQTKKIMKNQQIHVSVHWGKFFFLGLAKKKNSGSLFIGNTLWIFWLLFCVQMLLVHHPFTIKYLQVDNFQLFDLKILFAASGPNWTSKVNCPLVSITYCYRLWYQLYSSNKNWYWKVLYICFSY